MEVVDIEAELYRLIPSRFPPVQVFEGLVANDRLEEVALAESRTNPRLLSEDRLKASHDASPHLLQNFNHAPFKYVNPEGSMFFPPFPPVLEMADSRQTALAIAVARRERFLARTSEPPTGLDMRLLKTPIKGRFGNLSAVPIETLREERLRMTSSLPANLDGILFRPAERPSHRCFAVVNSRVLGYTLQTSHYRFWWDGSRIAAVYAFDEARRLDPSLFRKSDETLAA